MSKMKSDTPPNLLPITAITNNRRAMEELLELVRPAPKGVLDIRYGLGRWARSLLKKWPNVGYVGYEWDAKCCYEAWREDGVVLHNRPFTTAEGKGRHGSVDLLLADFNNSTSLKCEPLREALKVVRPRWVIFTDVASAKMHMNFRSYGLEEPSLEEYWKRFEVEGYRLVRWVQKQHAATTALYQKENP